MGILLSFLIVYLAGAKGGSEHLDEVAAAKAVRDSEEFHSLLSLLRMHVAATMRSLADELSEAPNPNETVLDRVRRLMERTYIDRIRR